MKIRRVDSKQCEVVADEFEHRRARPTAEQRQPSAFAADTNGRRTPTPAPARPALDTAGVQPSAIRSSAERLAVSQLDRAGERVDLRAGVVDVNSLVSGSQPPRQTGPGCADYRAAQWPTCSGRSGLAETYSTLTLGPCRRSTRRKPRLRQDRAQLVAPCVGLSRNCEPDRRSPPRPMRQGLELRADESARMRGLVLRFGQDHRRWSARSPCDGSRGGSTGPPCGRAGR